MANKRLSDLNELTHTQAVGSDLVLVADTQAVESKKMQLSELQDYILGSGGGNVFNGTASWANNAISSSIANTSLTTISASYAVTASALPARTSLYNPNLVWDAQGGNFVGFNPYPSLGVELSWQSSSLAPPQAIMRTIGSQSVWFGIQSFTTASGYWQGTATTASYAILAGSSSNAAATSSWAVSSSYALTASNISVQPPLGTALSFNGWQWVDSASFPNASLAFMFGGVSPEFGLNAELLVAARANSAYPLLSLQDDIGNPFLYNLIEITGKPSNGLIAWFDRNGIFHTTASIAQTANFLNYNGTNNGTVTLAISASLATTAQTALTVTTANIFRELPILTGSCVNPASCFFGFTQFTGSTGNPNVIVEAWGDVIVPVSQSGYSGSLDLIMENSGAAGQILQSCTFQNYLSASFTAAPSGAIAALTGSTIQSFYLKGRFNVNSPNTQRYSGSVRANNGLTFFTGSRQVECVIKTDTDSYLHE